MEFGRHISRGSWAFADKALPALYGIGFVFLVARVLPREEYGAFVIVQTLFNIISALGYTLALQPLTKFAAESDQPGSYAVASLLLQSILFGAASLLLYFLKIPIASLLDPVHRIQLAQLLVYIPLMLLASFYRNFAVSLLQSQFRVERIFWLDAIYFVGMMALVYGAELAGSFHTASDLLAITVLAFAASTLVAIPLTHRHVSLKGSDYRPAVIKIWNFGKYLFGGNVAYTLFSQMDVFFVTSLGGPSVVASYYNAKLFTRIFDLHSQVLQMFLVPFTSKLTTRRSTGELLIVVEKSICFSILFLLPVFLVMVALPGPLVHILFKGKYDDAAPIVRIFSVLALLVPWSGVLVSYLIGSGKVKQALYFGIFQLSLAAVAYLAFTLLFGAIGTSIALVLTFAIVTMLLARYVKRDIPVTFVSVVRRTGDVWDFVKRRTLLRANE